jgi:integrase
MGGDCGMTTRLIGKLKALNVEHAKHPGMYGDGGGLYLQVTGAGAKSWIFKYRVSERDPATGEFVSDPASGRVRGRTREMGLGSYHVVSLEEARRRAQDCRQLREKGIDPIAAREETKLQTALQKAQALKFRDAAEAYVAAHRVGWKNAKHAAQWPATLAAYAHPIIGDLSVQAIDTRLVLKVLEPIWTQKPETANRLRGRIEQVLDWAAARGYRQGDNPARWRGHLQKLLPLKGKVRRVKHHVALPYAALPGFMAALREQEGVAVRALEFTILTGARTGETLGARRQEINLREKLWTIPGSRMKAGIEHRVPLAERAVEILHMIDSNDSDFVFPSRRTGRPLPDRAMLGVLERMGREVTTHGFRSTFRDWAAERTNFANEVVEKALAHAVSDKVEAAYRRGDLFDKRRRLMDAWAAYCASKSATEPSERVVILQSA